MNKKLIYLEIEKSTNYFERCIGLQYLDKKIQTVIPDEM